MAVNGKTYSCFQDLKPAQAPGSALSMLEVLEPAAVQLAKRMAEVLAERLIDMALAEAAGNPAQNSGWLLKQPP